ncbi:chitin synthase III catalytic subunit [Chlamydoabsidia padenii]|nr:chitin synthase III catalytic subunit [Chlamydoabsidia padenii]
MVSLPLRFQAFKFDEICQTVALTLCPLIGKYDGIEPLCYARNVEFAGMLIFQPATLMIDLITIGMTAVMIYNVKTKYTAVGRKEITMFFQLYLITMLLEMLLVSNIIPSSSSLYPFFTSAHLGLGSATFWCLLLNGFVGFQFAEDGTPISLWSIRITSFAVFLIVGFVGMATFNNIGPFNYTYPIGLWVIYFIFNGACILIYLAAQLFLVSYTLEDRWPLGDITFGVLFFFTGQFIMFLFSIPLCDHMKHYLDGLFFGTTFNLLAVMMVYKYWDSITKEDLEFSIDTKHQEWQTLLIHDDAYDNEKKRTMPFD